MKSIKLFKYKDSPKFEEFLSSYRYKLDECIYLKKNKYTFKTELFWKNSMLIYCFVASKDGAAACLLQSLFTGFSKEEKNKAIVDYLNSKIKTLDCDL